MKILHYTLGLSEYRTGGLTKYTYDLMREQVNNNDDIYLLFPGQMKMIDKSIRIKFYKEVEKIKAYEIINPLPVSLMNGVKNPDKFMKKGDVLIYMDFLKKINPEIINIHTFMGLHKEFLIAANKLNIPLLYTTHDYYGLCMRVNFLNQNSQVCEEYDLEKCCICNNGGYSIKQIVIQQSRVYRELKNLGVIKNLKKIGTKINRVKKKNDNSFRYFNKNNSKKCGSISMKKEYNELLAYYKSMFKYVDRFIFNSSITKSVFNKYIKAKGGVITLTHKDIIDKRRLKNYSKEELRLTYLGPNKDYKGYYLLKNVMDKLNDKEYINIRLNIYGKTTDIGKISENIFSYGEYKYNELEDIFDKTDLLIVPSIWKETFGFITLEALSYGVPVLITSCVGSKDLIGDSNRYGIIVEPNEDDIFEKIVEINNDRQVLSELNRNIVKNRFEYLLNNHYEIINKIYKDELVNKDTNA